MQNDCLPLLIAALLLGACDEGSSSEIFFMPAGALTVFDRSASAYAATPAALTGAALARHRAGNVAFGATFTAASSGLGPLFNNQGCASCHVGAGRGLPVTGAGPGFSPMLVRVSLDPAAVAGGEVSSCGAGACVPEVPGGPIAVPGVGTQLQDHAVAGAEAEARVTVTWDEEAGRYGDGTAYALRRPRVAVVMADGSALGPAVQVSLRASPPAFGLGLLEAVPEAALAALADAEDADGDGISGRMNRVWDPVSRTTVLGRFGWKANAPSLAVQVAGAFAADMGVTSALFPAPGEPAGAPEIDDATLAATTFFVATLGAPEPWPGDDAAARALTAKGEAAFRALGCAGCHVETLTTAALGDAGEIVGVQTIHAYTDLLVHDLGAGLADGRPDFAASGTEWRTTPLWGLGLTTVVLPGATLLHDGRARDVAEAILWHGGEAEAAREAFRLASSAEREALVAFLGSR